MKLSVVAGARPNFMKVAPLLRALHDRTEVQFVHTGQHYHWQMSDAFLADLGMREPDVNLGVGSGTHAEQTAERIAEVSLGELKAADSNPSLGAVRASLDRNSSCDAPSPPPTSSDTS